MFFLKQLQVVRCWFRVMYCQRQLTSAVKGHRMGRVGRDIKGHPTPTPLPWGILLAFRAAFNSNI